MRASFRWLRSILNFEISASELAQTLDKNGLRVVETLDLGYAGEPIAIAEVQSVGVESPLTRQSVCRVVTGPGPARRVLGPAKGLKPGDRVVVALSGARLASGQEIAPEIVDGEECEGRICHGAELGWNGEADRALTMPDDYRVGEPLDFLLEVAVPPNRPDCLSIFGLARDLAALYGKKVYPPVFRFTEALDHTELFCSAAVRSRDRCTRYAGRYLKNIQVEPSPLWLKRALESGGISSVNNVVDTANYVMLMMGQPIGVYDADKIAGNQVFVRMAEDGEEVELADGSKIALTAEDLVVADNSRIMAVAGIAAAKTHEVDRATTNVFIEAACFTPLGVRKTASRLGLSTAASFRFERGVDRGRLTHVLTQAAYHLRELTGAEVAKGLIDIVEPLKANKPIGLNLDRLNRMLGLSLKGREVADILVALGFEILHFDHNTMTINVPTHRVDIQRDVDLIDEVARLHGLDKIAVSMPQRPVQPVATDEEMRAARSIRDLLVNFGFYEIVGPALLSRASLEPFGFAPDECILISNPLTASQEALRPSLAPAMLRAMIDNLRSGARDLRLFEVSRIYSPPSIPGEPPGEILSLCVGLCG